jgi:uncharacterized protein YyaL (SSP411 family)
MLYDNALLARRVPPRSSADRRPAAAPHLRGDPRLGAARHARSRGGFFAALDADSEGVEGKFYVWTVAELRDALGEDADAAIAWFGATEHGNFDEIPGANVLESRGPEPARETRERIRERLREVRERRVRPGSTTSAWRLGTR